MRKYFVIGAVGLLLVAALVVIWLNPGGRQPAQPPAPKAEVKNPDTLIIATIGDLETLDPAWHYDTASATAIFNVYETLIFYDREKIDKFVPLLAAEVPSLENGLIKTEPDGTTYITFKIRQGIKFHEGGELTPKDVEYTFERGLLQDRAGGPQWVLLEPMLGVSVIESKDPNSPGLVEQLKAQIAQENPNLSPEEVAQRADEETCLKVKQSVEVDGDKVIFKLVEPFLPILQILAGTWGSILDKEWVISLGGWDGDCATWRQHHDPPVERSELFEKMNGTGPFKLERWIKGQEISFVRNEDYWREPAKLKRAVIKIVEEWSTRRLMLETGDADNIAVDRQFIDQLEPLLKEEYVGGEADPQKLTTKNPQGTVRVYKNLPGLVMGATFFNQKVVAEGNPYIGSGQLDGNGIPPDFFSDIDVRKGFQYAFNWDDYIKGALKGEAEQPKGPIIRGVFGFNPNQLTYRYDIEKAAEHFKKAWGGAVWEKGFKFTILYNSGNLTRKAAAEILERGVESLNPKFQIEVRDVPWPTLLQDITAKRLPLYIVGWLEDFHDPHNWVHPFLFSKGAYAGFMSLPPELQQRLDELIIQARKELNVQKREQLYHELQRIAYEEAIELYLDQALGRRYERTWVHGWYYNPAYPGTYFYPLWKG